MATETYSQVFDQQNFTTGRERIGWTQALPVTRRSRNDLVWGLRPLDRAPPRPLAFLDGPTRLGRTPPRLRQGVRRPET